MQMWVIAAPKMLSYIVTGGRKTQKQQQQERNCCSQHFSFFFLRLKITTGKLLQERMMHLPPCCLFIQAATEVLCAEISSSCFMSSVLSTLLMGATRPALSHHRQAGIICWLRVASGFRFIPKVRQR